MISTRAKSYQGNGIRSQYLRITEHSKVGNVDEDITEHNHGDSNEQRAGESPKGEKNNNKRYRI